ncbi:MAG: TIGR00304 family membrane protein [Candidatus Bathyarchaeales archaeon]
MVDAPALYALGIVLVFVGILIVVVTLFLLSVSSAKRRKINGGGAVIIGPVPIIFGTDKRSLKTVLLLSLALTIMLVVFMVLQYMLMR